MEDSWAKISWKDSTPNVQMMKALKEEGTLTGGAGMGGWVICLWRFGGGEVLARQLLGTVQETSGNVNLGHAANIRSGNNLPGGDH